MRRWQVKSTQVIKWKWEGNKLMGKGCCVLDCDLICWILLWFYVTDMISIRLMINELRFNMRLMSNELWSNMILWFNVTDMKKIRLMIDELRFNLRLIFNDLRFNTRLWFNITDMKNANLLLDWCLMSYGLIWQVWLYCFICIISS